MKKSFIIMVIALPLILCTANAPIAAADYPIKPITLINPFPPGGALDVVSRIFAPVAGELLGQPMVVANKAGAMGLTGGIAGSQAAPDGYTLTVGSTAMTGTIEWEIMEGRKPPITRDDFISIACLTRSPALIIVAEDHPWKNLADLIKDCKAKPDHYAFSSSGPYGMSHLPAEILMKTTGLKCRHVSYKGGGPSLTAVVAKHVDFSTQWPSNSISFVHGKRLRVLAVMSDQRLKSIPDVPTAKELGIDVEYYAWVGILAPLKTPMDVIKKLREVSAKVVKEKSFVDAITKTGDEVHYMSGDELMKFWENESKNLAKLFEKLSKEKGSSK